MKAALYLRSSKDRSDVSIDAQRRALIEMAETRKFTIVAEYADAVESGKDEDRPRFQAMLKDMKLPDRKWQYILALDTARIARRRHIAIIFEEHECKRRGIKVIYKSLPESDPITEMLLKSILQAMDEWHSMTSRAKGLAGMSENVKQGWRAGGRAPKGYQLENVPTGAIRDGFPVTKSRLIPNNDAPMVKAFFYNRLQGIPRLKAIKLAGLNWTSSTAIDIEKNSLLYAGHTTWNRHNEIVATIEGEPPKSKFRPRNEWVVNRNTHESFITDDEAEYILSLFEKRKKTRERTDGKRIYLFTGIMVDQHGVGWCGNNGYYRVGKGKSILADSVEQTILNKVINDLSSDKFCFGMLQHYKNIASKAESQETPLQAIKEKIADLDKKIEKFTDLIAETSKPGPLLRKIEELESERENLSAAIDNSEFNGAIVKQMRGMKIFDVKRILEVITSEFDMNNASTLRHALARIIDQVVLDQNTLTATITYKLNAVSGVKLASPRLRQFSTCYNPVSVVYVPHLKRVPKA